MRSMFGAVGIAFLLVGSFTAVHAGNKDSLFVVCDGGDELWSVHRYDGGKTQLGDVGVPDVETIAYWPGTETLYAADAGDFGFITIANPPPLGTNLFTFIGEIDGGGTANGSIGAVALDDIDGLSFDPWTSILWASSRRPGDYDLLFQINPATGMFIPDAFGPGIDYVRIDGTGVYFDIDDIAISPSDGKMYTIATQAGSAQVLEINKYTGAVDAVVATDEDDVEGLAYHNDGTFWGTVGTADEFWQVNPITGEMTNRVDLNNAQCTDPEAVAALVADINTMRGRVWNDLDFDGVLDGGESGISGITVQLYYDWDSSGTITAQDILIQEQVTDGSGNYTFLFAARAHLLTKVDASSVPIGFAFTTDNIETANFNDFGQTDVSNDFGLATGPDCDGDGIPDFAEGGVGVDADFDGIDNMCDLDSDNDGVLDSVEGIVDCDNDGIPNYLDKDSDNDGIADGIEANGGLIPAGFTQVFGRFTGADTDGDGLLDILDNAPAVQYGLGSTSTLPNPDTDGDGVNDVCDKDSDNDGLMDVLEGGGTDANKDGVIDGFADVNGDGYYDNITIFQLPIPSTDFEYEDLYGLPRIPDYLDLDSDNDGIVDEREGQPTAGFAFPAITIDTDGDGTIDEYDIDQGGNPGCEDTDSDGTPDYIDTDTDNDGETDAVEGNDADLNGIADSSPSGVDTDGDGIDDTFDTTPAAWGPASNVPLKNQDGDDEPDWRDLYDSSNPGVFFYVCDGTDQLYNHNRTNASNGLRGPTTGAVDIEAIAYYDRVLYAADAGVFGTLNQGTGAFTAIGQFDGGGANANGVDGLVTLNDVDGLTFDPWTGILWGVERNGVSGDGDYDYLFQVNLTTGQFVADAFGTGVDYIEVDGSGVFDDIDDAAIDPITGTMYLVANDGIFDQLLQINKYTGAVIVASALTQQDVEGMAFHNDGTLWGSRGTSPGQLWQIDPSNGTVYNRRDLSCADVEAFAGLVAPINTISGTVWNDIDMDQVIDGGEGGIATVTVNLYRDVNGNGIIDGGDISVQTTTTNGAGFYSFKVAAPGRFITAIDVTTLPAGYGLTTDNVEVVNFVDTYNFRESDLNNNFGATTGTDCDSDGIPDFSEGGPGTDTDGDGVDDMCDLDSDNDGILDSVELQVDSDGDGIFNYVDLDSDNDGIPDAIEANAGIAIVEYGPFTGQLAGIDSDLDGLIDAVDNNPGAPYGAGSTSAFANPDSDGDGVPDYRDGDSDNDGILDVIEAGGTDANNDGDIDGWTDGNGDGYADALNATPLPITNADAAQETGCGLPLRPGYIDRDSDNDGIDDTREGLSTAAYAIPVLTTDNDGDGVIDFWDIDYSGTPITPVDTDGDNIRDYNDNDSDDDTIIDLIEGNDADMNGVADYVASCTDTDGDGIDNTYDTTPVGYGGRTNTPHQDSNSDGEDDWRDTDDDGDGINTVDEPVDLNVNGIPDYLEISLCGPGFVQGTVTSGNADAKVAENSVANDGNILGAPDAAVVSMNSSTDWIELDLTDNLPAGTSIQIRVYGTGLPTVLGVRESADAVTWDPPLASSATLINITNGSPPIDYAYVTVSTTRYVRLESPDPNPRVDALSYSFATCLADTDQDGVPNTIDVDDDNDGILDTVEGAVDSDGDGITDDLDLDSDNDGIPDAVEANGGVLPGNMLAEGHFTVAYIAANDFNNNGLGDAFDPAAGNPLIADTNTDGLGNPNRLDLDSDNDCIPDAIEANGGSLPANMDSNGQFPIAYATANDIDGDGLIDDVDPDAAGTALVNPDTDSDGATDFVDIDADGDLVPDAQEGTSTPGAPSGLDFDGDGIDNACDADNGGTPADLPDDDCNGIANYLDRVVLTAQSGPFNAPATWVGGIIPATLQSISILDGHTVQLTANTNLNSVNIAPAGTLDINGVALNLTGSFIVQGVFAAGETGSVNFVGSTCPQTICGGDILFSSLSVNNSNGVNVTCGDVAFTDTLCLSSGDLNVTGANSFTFISNATDQASLCSGGLGDIVGPVTLQRHKTGCVEAFFSMCSPISVTYQDWANGGVSLYGFTNAPFAWDISNTYWYNESMSGPLTSGWTEPTDFLSGVTRGLGYYVYQGLSAFPLNIVTTGTVDLDPFAFPISHTNTGAPTIDGYNLLGNPYPSALRWNMGAGGGWTNVGCCDAIFTWDECNDQYESYAGGVGTNGGTGIIASHQSFWVKYHSPVGALSVNRNAIVTDPGDFKQGYDMPKVMHLQLIDSDGHFDEAAVRLHAAATEDMDLNWDGGKLHGNNGSREIYTVAGTLANGMAMAINALPDNGQDRSIPVMVRVPQTGTYELKVKGIHNYPDDICIVIEDNLTGNFFDPKADTAVTYAFVHTSDTIFDNRFTIHMGYPLEANGHNTSCIGSNDGYAVANHPGSGPFQFTWTDSEGHVVRQVTTASATDTLQDRTAGSYTITVIDQGAPYCTSIVQQVSIGSPAYELQATTVAHDLQCNGESGRIDLAVVGGTAPYTYVWSNNQTVQDPENLSPGTYTVEITDANGCTTAAQATVETAIPVTAAFSLSGDTINLYYNQAFEPANTSIGATAYTWDFGDSTELSIAPEPSHLFDSVGTYVVVLVAMNGTCVDSDTTEVVVINHHVITGTPELAAAGGDQINLFEHRSRLFIQLDLTEAVKIQFDVYDALGQIVKSATFNPTNSVREIVDLHHYATGTYLVKLKYGKEERTAKIVVSN